MLIESITRNLHQQRPERKIIVSNVKDIYLQLSMISVT